MEELGEESRQRTLRNVGKKGIYREGMAKNEDEMRVKV